ncbi:hypothetical protein AFL22_02390 [Pantoea sp. CFSAN033090]|nr:hypothetical protein AFL22_02390 [Pantoea sp. CFSAN033090]
MLGLLLADDAALGKPDAALFGELIFLGAVFKYRNAQTLLLGKALFASELMVVAEFAQQHIHIVDDIVANGFINCFEDFI